MLLSNAINGKSGPRTEYLQGLSGRSRPMSYLIVGAGLFGSVCARELTDAGKKVLLLEKRDHIGGNCFTVYEPEAGCHHHVYGPHVFHTNSESVWNYINRFTDFNHYVHRTKVNYRGQVYSFPINLFTLYQVFGTTTPGEAEDRLGIVRNSNNNSKSLEDWCLSQVGQELYEIFIRGYTCKQWQKDPRELPSEIVRRLPIRTTYDDRYFSDRYQGIPVDGYTAIFKRMLSDIPCELGVDFLDDRDAWMRKFDHIIFTGPIDAFFGYSNGTLEYRSLRFESQLLNVRDAQGVAIINYTDGDIPYTRTVEHKHFDMNLQKSKTIVTTEYPEDWKPGRSEFYPINTKKNQSIYLSYKANHSVEKIPVTFGGRLGNYRYYDMDQVIASALRTVHHLIQQ
jgi:UDP-galactopyranose mutase